MTTKRDLADIEVLIATAKEIPEIDVYANYPLAVDAAIKWLNLNKANEHECTQYVMDNISQVLEYGKYSGKLSIKYLKGHKPYARAVCIKLCDDNSLGTVMSALIIYCATEMCGLDTFEPNKA